MLEEFLFGNLQGHVAASGAKVMKVSGDAPQLRASLGRCNFDRVQVVAHRLHLLCDSLDGDRSEVKLIDDFDQTSAQLLGDAVDNTAHLTKDATNYPSQLRKLHDGVEPAYPRNVRGEVGDVDLVEEQKRRSDKTESSRGGGVEPDQVAPMS